MEKEKKQIMDLYMKQKVADVFDKNRSKYGFQRYKHKIESKILLNAIKLSKKRKIKILDVGCGTGRFLPDIFNLDKNFQYFGLDTSEAMVKKLKERADKLGKNVCIVKSDATKIPYKDNSFDVVYTFHLLWHLPKQEQKKILLEMIRVAKNNGIIVFDILNKDFIYEKFKKLKKKKATQGIHKLSLDDIYKMIGKRHFKINKLNDAIIKKNFIYNIFNFLNKVEVVFPNNFFHMLYFTFKK